MRLHLTIELTLRPVLALGLVIILAPVAEVIERLVGGHLIVFASHAPLNDPAGQGVLASKVVFSCLDNDGRRV